MNVGVYMIGMVKINTQLFYKETIYKIKKDYLGDYYLVLRIKPMVHRGRLIISVDHKYNARKVIYFIVTEDTGSKK